MKTIYNVYVPMESQEQCDKMKQICLSNGLPVWDWFDYLDNSIFCFDEIDFYIMKNAKNIENHSKDKTQVTEAKFIELLKQHKQ